MIKKLDLNDKDTVMKILELQLVSYKIEAEIIGFSDIPPLKDTDESLKTCNEVFYGYFANDNLAGIVSYKIIEDALDIHRLAVNPNYFRMGIGEKLINFIEENEKSANKLLVSTGKDNHPAVNLYIKNGFKRIRDIEVKNDIYLTEFEKVLRV